MQFTFKDVHHAVADKFICKARPMKPGKGIYLNLLSREYYQNDFLF